MSKINKEHLPFIKDVYINLYLETRLNRSQVIDKTYSLFQEKYPDVDCTKDTFMHFIKNNRIRLLKSKLPQEEYTDQIIEILKEIKSSYTNCRKAANEIFRRINGNKRRVSIDYVKKVVSDNWDFVDLPIVESKDFNKEWLPKYDAILFRCYQDKRSCYAINVNEYYKRFTKIVGKVFDEEQVFRKLLDIMPEPEYGVKRIKDIDKRVMKKIHDNLIDFSKRGLDYPTIAKKVLFFLYVEGYKATIDDAHRIIKQLSFTTNNHEQTI